MPHAGYTEEDLDMFYDQLYYSLQTCFDQRRHLILCGDFNSQLGVRDRGHRMDELCAAFNLQILNSEFLILPQLFLFLNLFLILILLDLLK